MRIADVVRRFAFDEWGGTETVVWHTAQKLHEAGHNVEVLATQALCKTAEEVRDGIPIHRFRYFYPHLFLSAANTLTLDKKGGSPFSYPLYHHLLHTPYDLIHSHAMGRIAAMALKAAHIRKVPFVLSFHGGNYDVPKSEFEEMAKPLRGSIGYGRFLEKLGGFSREIVEQADGIICVGKNEFDLVRERFPNKHAEYIPNGVDCSLFRHREDQNPFREEYGIPKDRKILLCLSRIDYQKNQKLLVKLVDRLVQSGENVHCVIIGFVTSATYLAEIRSDITASHLEDRFTIIEGLPPQSTSIISAYQSADLFILPSIHEPFGIVVLEAWSASIPVIASAVGGLKTLIKNGTNGFLFDPSDFNSLLNAYHSAIKDRDKICANASREVSDQYSWEAVVARLLNFYTRVIHDFKGR